MKKRIIQVNKISERVEEACLKANYELRQDARSLIELAIDHDNEPAARLSLEHLIANFRLASRKKIPLCQDCGYVSVFVELGQEIDFDGDFNGAIQDGVAASYKKNNLRQSVIADALFDRENFNTENLASIYVTLAEGGKLKLSIMPKGGGSDNASRLNMMRPTSTKDEIIDFIVGTVSATGLGACPPLFIGVGIGGSFDSAALLAKKAMFRRFDQPNSNPQLAELESIILRQINSLGIGPAGLGGSTTALGVSILTAPSHMACLPVAVNIGCNSLRSVEIEL